MSDVVLGGNKKNNSQKKHADHAHPARRQQDDYPQQHSSGSIIGAAVLPLGTDTSTTGSWQLATTALILFVKQLVLLVLHTTKWDLGPPPPLPSAAGYCSCGAFAVSKHPPGTMVFSLLLPPASSIHHQHQYHQCTTITSIIRISSPLSLAISVAASSISGIISSTISILRSYQEPYQVTRSSSINSMHDLSSKKEMISG